MRWMTPQPGRRRRSASRRRAAHRARPRRAPLIILLALVLLPAFAGRNLIQDLIFLFYMLALAQCWNLLAGYAGLVSVGQQAFVGLGGYLLFALTLIAGLDPLLAILLGGRSSPALLALPTALVVFRLRGAYFAIGTWVVAEVYRLVFAQVKPLGGGTGTSLHAVDHHRPCPASNGSRRCFDVRTPAARDIVTYWLALALVGRHARARSISSFARAAAWRSPRSAITRPRPQASASTSFAPSSRSMSRPPP